MWNCFQIVSILIFIDITTFNGVKPALRPRDMKFCTEVIPLCTNITTFHCSPSSIQAYLPSLQNLRSLENLRINAHLTADQTEMLVRIQGIKNLTLDHASWQVVSALPKWAAEKLSPKLASLTLYVSNAFTWKSTMVDGMQMTTDLNEFILDKTLSVLPRLEGLHIISCGKLDHVALLTSLRHTPILESLSFTTWVCHVSLFWL